MPTLFAVVTDIDAQIADVLNAAAEWAGAITLGSTSADAIALARKQSWLEIIRAIGGNPEGPYWATLATYVDHEIPDGEDGVRLADHEGEVGIPKIVPFEGATPRSGRPADPDEIDAYRLETADKPCFTGEITGVGVPHDQADEDGTMSSISCRYSIVTNYLKFTGKTCKVPMIVITEAMLTEKILLALSPTVTKRAIPKLVKPGSNIALIAGAYGADGKQDLVEINGGAISVRPVRSVADIIASQKAA
jgi:hypothetical protein